MRRKGELWVFEGPDGVGKSTLSAEFAARLRSYGIETEHWSFPGREAGTLGKLVYDIHHDPSASGVEFLTAASLQTLHIAAHLDAIENRIVPALNAGKNVVLDRFWWSTWVYGIVGGVSPQLLKSLLVAERHQWGKVLPSTIFLITRPRSWRDDEAQQNWQQLASTYRDLAVREGKRCPVELVPNEDAPDLVMERIVELAARNSRTKSLKILAKVEAELHPQKKTVQSLSIKRSVPQTTAVFDTYWRFAAKRQEIFFRRAMGCEKPWSDDEILQKHKFTNAYRASDRVSQFLIRHVIYPPDGQTPRDMEDTFFRTLLFKIFNRISTWEAMEKAFGSVSYESYDFDRYDALFCELRGKGQRIFSSAYIMPSGSSFGYSDKHRNYLKLLERMIEDGVPYRLQELKTMREAFELLLSYPTMGNFLAYQFATDLNYSPLTNFSEMDFVMPGPGARDGIAKCFSDLNGYSEAEAIRWVTERQVEEFARRDIEFQDLWGRPLQLIDCQNLFCEVDKYARVAHPEAKGLSGRTRIKQLFQPNEANHTYWYPPKWGLNSKILATSLHKTQSQNTEAGLLFDEAIF